MMAPNEEMGKKEKVMEEEERMTFLLRDCGAANDMEEEEKQARRMLREAKAYSFNNIVVDLPVKKLETFMRVAMQEGMISSNYSFILTTIDLEAIELRDYQWNRANITAFRLVKSQGELQKSKWRER